MLEVRKHRRERNWKFHLHLFFIFYIFFLQKEKQSVSKRKFFQTFYVCFYVVGSWKDVKRNDNLLSMFSSMLNSWWCCLKSPLWLSPCNVLQNCKVFTFKWVFPFSYTFIFQGECLKFCCKEEIFGMKKNWSFEFERDWVEEEYLLSLILRTENYFNNLQVKTLWKFEVKGNLTKFQN